MAKTQESSLAWTALKGVLDPEIPVISVVDLGIINSVMAQGDSVKVSITPTYVACVAAEIMRTDIEKSLERAGFEHIDVTIRYAPAWTSDRMSAEGRQKLQDYGIAPPPDVRGVGASPDCPVCRASTTSLISAFGSSACKSLHKCDACGEVFECFKCK